MVHEPFSFHSSQKNLFQPPLEFLANDDEWLRHCEGDNDDVMVK